MSIHLKEKNCKLLQCFKMDPIKILILQEKIKKEPLVKAVLYRGYLLNSKLAMVFIPIPVAPAAHRSLADLRKVAEQSICSQFC